MTDLPPQGPPGDEPWSPPPLAAPNPAPGPHPGSTPYPPPGPPGPPPGSMPYPPPGSPPPPGGPPPGYGYGPGPSTGYGYPSAGYGYGYPAPAPRTNGLAIASLVCGICSFVVCPFLAVAGLITGFRARRQIRESNGQEQGDGLALAGLIVSGLGMLYMVGMIVVYAFIFGLLATLPRSPTTTVPPRTPFPTSTTTTLGSTTTTLGTTTTTLG